MGRKDTPFKTWPSGNYHPSYQPFRKHSFETNWSPTGKELLQKREQVALLPFPNSFFRTVCVVKIC